ncbi:hypothetical protein RUM43_006765 [Polyplax serrata]|uniref:Uncharacterized protein n=1 Tax=Polyplax serrata TaxID=468196 RepID=A0AAN8PLF7_POLSC
MSSSRVQQSELTDRAGMEKTRRKKTNLRITGVNMDKSRTIDKNDFPTARCLELKGKDLHESNRVKSERGRRRWGPTRQASGRWGLCRGPASISGTTGSSECVQLSGLSVRFASDFFFPLLPLNEF